MDMLEIHNTDLFAFRFDCFLKCTIETNFYNVVFIAHSENVLLFFHEIFVIKSYYDFKLFIYYVFVKKHELKFFQCFTCNSIIFDLYSWYRTLSKFLVILNFFLISNNETPAFTENKVFWISIIVLMFLSLTWYQEYRPKIIIELHVKHRKN